METEGDLAALIDDMFREKLTWPELVKKIRAASEVDIFTAEKMALSHTGWRRLCEHLINHDRECRKQAAYHLKHHGPRSLVAIKDGRYVIAPVTI